MVYILILVNSIDFMENLLLRQQWRMAVIIWILVENQRWGSACLMLVFCTQSIYFQWLLSSFLQTRTSVTNSNTTVCRFYYGWVHYQHKEFLAHSPQQKHGEQGWCSDESACLRPMWAGFDSTLVPYMGWVFSWFLPNFNLMVFLCVLWFSSLHKKPSLQIPVWPGYCKGD